MLAFMHDRTNSVMVYKQRTVKEIERFATMLSSGIFMISILFAVFASGVYLVANPTLRSS